MRSYEVLAYQPGLHNGLDGYVSLGVHKASNARTAANRALRILANDPRDSENDPILWPDPSIVVVPLGNLIPLEGLTIPKEIVEDWELGWEHEA